MNKRGIGPLIASVLLIAFTIVLAAMIISWGSGFFNKISSGNDERTAKFMACTGDLNFHVNLKCPNIATLENNGEINIKKFVLRFFKEDEFLGTGNLGGVNKNDLQKFIISNVPMNTNKIDFLAIVDVNGKEITCSEVQREAFISC